ncbi:hypothetical protein A2U01_0116959, partial [Trifolium medium]|nr:hypothetical protein [Trifolium medium]
MAKHSDAPSSASSHQPG